MSGTPFLRIPFVIPGASALTLDADKVTPMFNSSPVSPIAPGATTGLDAVGGFGSVALTWTAPTTGVVAGYIIEARIAPAGAWISTVWESTTPAFSYDALTNNVSYNFRVTAYGPGGLGSPSNIDTAMPISLVEPGAVAQWQFGSDNTTLTDLVVGKVLHRALTTGTPTPGSGYTAATVSASDDSSWAAVVSAGAVTKVYCTNVGTGTGVPTLTISGDGTGAAATAIRGPAPTNSAGYVQTAVDSGGVGGLVSDITDKLTQTMCVVARWPTSSPNTAPSTILAGALDTSDVPGGSALYETSAGGTRLVAYNVRGSGSAYTWSATSALSAGSWYFAALVEAPGSNANFLYVGSLGQSATSTRTKVTSGHKIAVGNAQYRGSTFEGQAAIAEKIYFDTAKSVADLDAIYLRSKARMAARGITVL